jgi:hypothetical protein
MVTDIIELLYHYVKYKLYFDRADIILVVSGTYQKSSSTLVHLAD